MASSTVMGKIMKATQNLSPTFVLTVVGTMYRKLFPLIDVPLPSYCANQLGSMVLIGFISYWGAIPEDPNTSSTFRFSTSSVAKQFKAFTWNMAAINNNPFGNPLLSVLHNFIIYTCVSFFCRVRVLDYERRSRL